MSESIFSRRPLQVCNVRSDWTPEKQFERSLAARREDLKRKFGIDVGGSKVEKVKGTDSISVSHKGPTIETDSKGAPLKKSIEKLQKEQGVDKNATPYTKEKAQAHAKVSDKLREAHTKIYKKKEQEKQGGSGSDNRKRDKDGKFA